MYSAPTDASVRRDPCKAVLNNVANPAGPSYDPLFHYLSPEEYEHEVPIKERKPPDLAFPDTPRRFSYPGDATRSAIRIALRETVDPAAVERENIDIRKPTWIRIGQDSDSSQKMFDASTGRWEVVNTEQRKLFVDTLSTKRDGNIMQVWMKIVQREQTIPGRYEYRGAWLDYKIILADFDCEKKAFRAETAVWSLSDGLIDPWLDTDFPTEWEPVNGDRLLESALKYHCDLNGRNARMQRVQ